MAEQELKDTCKKQERRTLLVLRCHETGRTDIFCTFVLVQSCPWPGSAPQDR